VTKKKNRVKAPAVKSAKQAKSLEVNMKVPLTGASFMSVLLICLLALIGYSGYLGVNSIWKFTHPKFAISTDRFRALGYLAKNQVIPPMPSPTFSTSVQPDAASQTEFLSQVSIFKSEFRSKFPGSKLLRLSDNDVLTMGDSFCSAKEKSIIETGNYSADEIISAHQAKFLLQYPLMSGLDFYLAGIGQRSFDYLCRSN
jgi:hypothetical protein